MENKNNETIRVKIDEEIISIVNKLKQCEKNEITLLVPSSALLLQSVVNLKILKKKASELGKNISIITTDENDKNIENSQTPEITSEAADDAPKPISVSDNFKDNSDALDKSADLENSAAKKKKVKMFDIVRKVDKMGDQEKEKETNLSSRRSLSAEDCDEQTHDSLQSSAERLQRGGNNSDIINHKIKTETEVKNAEESKSNEEWFNENEQDNIEISKSESVNTPKFQENASSKKAKNRRNLLPSISSKVFAAFMFSCIAITALIAFFIFQKVDIIVALKTQETDYNFEFVTDESIGEIDAVYNKIPVERIEVISEKTETYSTMGKKRVTEKARGEITVYNEYSSNPQKIVANTRFLSKGGQLFKIVESITIPGFSRVEGKDVPGEVTAAVYADIPGEEYNIGASSFTLPGLQGHPKYSSIYARSTQAMSGGIDKDVLYFSESDYITAKDKLVKIAKEESEQDFLSKVSDQVRELENTRERSDTEVKTDIKVGATANNFEMTVLVKTSALFINKNNLDNLISAKINSELAENMELVEGSRNYEVGETVRNENGSVTIPVQITQGLITKVDIDKIREEIAGKNELELNNYFNNIREIESVNIEFWPNWVKSVPAAWDKINMEFGK